MSSPKEEVFKVSNLISHLKKQNINIKSAFSYENRLVFLCVTYSDIGLELFIYVPSKYNIQTEKSIGLPSYELAIDEGEETKGEDGIFINETVTTAVRKARKEKSSSLGRFVPLLAEQPYKMIYVDDYYMVYIDRHNEVSSFILSSPPINKGYFFTTDMEYFLKTTGHKIYNEIRHREKALCDTVYNKINVSMIDNRATLVQLQQRLRDLNPERAKLMYIQRLQKIDTILTKGKNESCVGLSNKIRSENFNNMFDMEKCVHILNSLK